MVVPSAAPISTIDPTAPPLPRISVPLTSARARAEHEVRHRRDRRQRFAAESHRPDRREVVRAADLARGVTLEREARVFRRHPLAVVFDAHLFLAAELDVDR